MQDKILRIKIGEGNFVTVSRKILMDERLTDTAFRLIVYALNNSDEWKLNITYLKNYLGWSPKKLASAKKNLEELGYLKCETTPSKKGKGKIYTYTIIEDQDSLSELQLVNFSKETSVSELQKVNTNENNIKEIKLDEIKLNEMKCNENVDNSKVESLSMEEQKQHNTTHSNYIEREFFFKQYEQPSQEKIIEYVQKKKGYPVEVAIDIHKILLKSDFKNKSGERIKGIQGYIDAILSTKNKEQIQYNTLQDENEFLKEVDSFNKECVNQMCSRRDLDSTTQYLKMKDSAVYYFKLIGRSKNGYIQYFAEFADSYLRKNGKFPSASSFLKHVKGNNERIISSIPGDESEKEVETFIKKEPSIEEITKRGTDYFNRKK